MADNTATETKEETKESKKAPLPKGFVTPVQFAKALSEKENREVRPQIIYGYIKNNGPESKNPFPSDRNSDGAFMVNEQEGYKWIAALRKRQEERAQAREEKAKASEEKSEG